MSSSYAAAAAGGAGWRPPFTASQWQELEHQALIFKYLVAGVPVPPELLVPILKSFESMAARFYHHPTSLGYCSLYGKKLDPEPWRCRRTDGKKWRCSKNAYPDSKYCERHMHRGRNRSRKPVETTTTPTTLSQPPTSSPSSSSSTVTTLAPSGGAKSLPCSSGTGMIPFPSSLGSGGGGDSAAQVLSLTCRSGGLGQQLQIGPAGYYYQMAGGDNCRYNNLLLGVKSEEVDEHNFLSEASAGSATGLGGAIEASLDNPWQLMPSQLHNGGGGGPPRRPQSMQDFDREASSSLCAAGQQQKQQQQQHCFFGSELDVGKAAPAMKQQQGQPLLSFFDEWPKYTRDSWSDLDQDDRSNNRTSSFSTTQLSISMPVAPSSSDFSATSSRSPNGGGGEED